MYFTTTKELNQQQVRWSKELAQYNFKITHQRESENTKTDALSQRKSYMRNVPKTRDTILWQNQFKDIKYNYRVAVMLQTNNDNFKKKIKRALAQDQIAQDI